MYSLTSGSSPLARGLLKGREEDTMNTGIIPARAGFTSAVRSRARARWDHPRSRGVYHALTYPVPRGTWIIPARAGFTVRGKVCGGRAGDHPRSRGVYQKPVITGPRVPGIIPARAGFTLQAGSARITGEDHPRSRGVYVSAGLSDFRPGGSSPLARGLRPVDPAVRARAGIIPARAGFTVRMACRQAGSRDHPRSRGVYRCLCDCVHVCSGSSPLARGLHLRILGIPTNPYSTRPRLPSLPT